GLRRVRRPEDVGVVPDEREADDHGHDDEAHDRVVEHRERVERLAVALDVLLVALEGGALLFEGARGHYSGRPVTPRALGRTRPLPAGAAVSSRSRPAASADHGGEETPRRTTRYRWRVIRPRIAPGKSSMC